MIIENGLITKKLYLRVFESLYPLLIIGHPIEQSRYDPIRESNYAIQKRKFNQ